MCESVVTALGYILLVELMKELRTKIRKLTSEYDDEISSINKIFNKELKDLQAQCSHDRTSRWRFELDEYGSINANQDGIPYLQMECYDCGSIKTKLNDTVFKPEMREIDD